MEVNIQDTGPINKKILIKLDKLTVEKEYDDFLNTAQSKTVVKGFRPGKAPKNIIRTQLADAAKAEISVKLVHQAMTDAIRDYNLSLAGNPTLTEEYRQTDKRKYVGNFHLDGTFSFEVAAEVEPILESLNYDNLTISRTLPTVEETVEKKIEEYRQQFAIPVPVQRPAQYGDQVLIDFVGTVGGKEFNYNHKELYSIQIGIPSYIVGFTDMFAGKQEGDQFSFEILLPDNFGDQSVAGQQAKFDCLVHSISQIEFPEIDDNLAQQIGFDNLELLRADLKSKIGTDDNKEVKALLIEEITDTLLRNNDFQIPSVWVSTELKTLASRLGLTTAPNKEEIVGLIEIAKRSVKRSFLLDKIYQAEESLHMTPEDLKTLFIEEGKKHGKSAEEILTILRNNQQYEGFVSYYQQLRAVDFLLGRAKLQESVVC